MSYVVLARKWRPMRFEDLVGQDHVSRTLGNAIDSGRVAHAFLFTGVRGVGKTTSARILAKALCCLGDPDTTPPGTDPGPTIRPCLKCAACLEIAQGSDVDVREIDGASYNGVDEVRKLQDSLPYRPSRDRFKIFIIDEVHMLSTNAWNAFLKTLEEPPPHVKFIFATTEVHKVPITILSRVQRFDFKLIPTQVILGRLRYVLEQEKIESDDAALGIIAREAAGSMRDAMSLLDQVIAWGGSKLTGEDVARVLGVASRKVLHEIAAALVRGDAPRTLEIVAELANQGFDTAHVARDLLSLLRDIVVAKVCKEPGSLLDLADEEARDVSELAGASDADDLIRLHQGFSQGFDDVVRSGQPRAALEMLLVRLARRPPLLPIDELVRRLAALEQRLGAPRGPQPSGGPPRGPGPAPQRPPPAPDLGSRTAEARPREPRTVDSARPEAPAEGRKEPPPRESAAPAPAPAPRSVPPRDPPARDPSVRRVAPAAAPTPDPDFVIPDFDAPPDPSTRPVRRVVPAPPPGPDPDFVIPDFDAPPPEPSARSVRRVAPAPPPGPDPDFVIPDFDASPPEPSARPVRRVAPAAPPGPDPDFAIPDFDAPPPEPAARPVRRVAPAAPPGPDPDFVVPDFIDQPEVEKKPVLRAAAPPRPPQQDPNPKDLADFRAILDRINERRAELAAFLAHAAILEFTPGELKLGFEPGGMFSHGLDDKESQDLLASVASEHFGVPTRVSFEFESARAKEIKTLATIDTEIREQKQRDAVANAKKHRGVTDAIEVLGARIKDLKLGPLAS